MKPAPSGEVNLGKPVMRARAPRPTPGPEPSEGPLAAPAAPAPFEPLVAERDRAEAEAEIRRLRDGVERLAAEASSQAAAVLLREALEAVRGDDPRLGAAQALKALELDRENGLAWHVLAVCRERTDDFTSALGAYEHALRLLPEDPRIGNDLGRLAYRMGMLEPAEKLFRGYLAADPTSVEAANSLANVLRDQFRFADAVALARDALARSPEFAPLWNTLGTVMAEQGDLERALVFFEEALRLDPGFAKARYNRANSLLAKGQVKLAQLECESALDVARLDSDLAMMRLARANMLLVAGDLEAGWEDYEVRLSPHFADVLHFVSAGARWTPEDDLDGKRLLIFGEQGLGDEILFASILKDVAGALGPRGSAVLACEPRLQGLFARSFPDMTVVPHATGKLNHMSVRSVVREGVWDGVDLWTPIASLLRRFRKSLADFPEDVGYLKPDPAASARWRETLEALPGRKVGVVWKSGIRTTKRARYFAPFEDWEPILKTPGLSFVTLQYGEAEAELETARRNFGVEVWTPPGLDLKNDLEELAGLMSALDLVIGPPNAATNLAAALGVETWILTYPGTWTRLGTEHFPWYPNARAFPLDLGLGWGEATSRLARALADR